MSKGGRPLGRFFFYPFIFFAVVPFILQYNQNAKGNNKTVILQYEYYNITRAV